MVITSVLTKTPTHPSFISLFTTICFGSVSYHQAFYKLVYGNNYEYIPHEKEISSFTLKF
jgi:hypothetical protein